MRELKLVGWSKAVGGTLALAFLIGVAPPRIALGDEWGFTANLPTVTLAGMGITLGQPASGVVPTISSAAASAAASAWYGGATVGASLLRSISDSHQSPQILDRLAWVEIMEPGYLGSEGPDPAGTTIPSLPGGVPCGEAGCASVYCAKTVCAPQLPPAPSTGLGGTQNIHVPPPPAGGIPAAWRMVFVDAQTGQVLFGAASTGTS